MSEPVPLHSVEAEMSALGACLYGAGAVDEVRDLCSREDFFREAHRDIFRAIELMSNRGVAVDLVSLKHELVRRQLLDQIGGEEYLIRVAEFVPSPANAAHYAKIVRENAILRNLDALGDRIKAVVRDHEIESTEDRIAAVEALVRDADTDLALPPIALSSLRIDTSRPRGLLTGLKTIDRITGFGLPRNQVSLFEAYTGHGKTTLMLTIVYLLALRGVRVGWFTLTDQTPVDLMEKLVTMMSGVRGRPQQPELVDDWSQAYKQLIDGDEFADDPQEGLLPIDFYWGKRHGLSVERITAAMRQWHKKSEYGVFVIDYAQVIRKSKPGRDSYRDTVEISHTIREAAESLGPPVMMGSQISFRNQGVVSKDGGVFEEDAGLILRLKRSEDGDDSRATIDAPPKRFNPACKRVIGWDSDRLMFCDR